MEDRHKEETNDSSHIKGFKKILVIIAIITVFVLLIVIIPYIINFAGTVSPEHKHWAEFGDYFGGFLNPLLGFITIIVLIITLGISFETLRLTKEELQQAREMLENTRQELKLNREIAEKQIKNIQDESLKNELLDITKQVDLEIQKVFDRKADFSQSGHNFGHYFSFSSTSASKKEIPVHRKYKFTDNDRVSILDLCDLIQQMEGYLNQYDKNFGISSPRTYYFKRKYLNVYLRLVEKEFLFDQQFQAFKDVGYMWSAPAKNN